MASLAPADRFQQVGQELLQACMASAKLFVGHRGRSILQSATARQYLT